MKREKEREQSFVCGSSCGSGKLSNDGISCFIRLSYSLKFHDGKCTPCSLKYKFPWGSEEVHHRTNLAVSIFIPGPDTCREQMVLLSHQKKEEGMFSCAFWGGRCGQCPSKAAHRAGCEARVMGGKRKMRLKTGGVSVSLSLCSDRSRTTPRKDTGFQLGIRRITHRVDVPLVLYNSLPYCILIQLHVLKNLLRSEQLFLKCKFYKS